MNPPLLSSGWRGGGTRPVRQLRSNSKTSKNVWRIGASLSAKPRRIQVYALSSRASKASLTQSDKRAARFFRHAFRQLCCVPQCSEPRLCPLGQLKCAYADIFSPSPSAERLCRNQDIPRPFIFRPLCSGRSIFLVRESFHFELILIGRAIESLPLDWTHKGPPSQAGQ